MDSSFAAQWEPALAHLNSGQTLRILFDRLSQNPMPYFYAGLEGAVTGFFDVVLDFQRDEPFLLGQFQKVGARTFYDVWTTHAVPGFAPRPASFRGVSYIVETSILSDNSLEASTSVRIRAETGGEHVLTFQLSRALNADKVSNERGEPLAFFQNEGMNLQQRSARGLDFLSVVLPEAPSRNQEFTLKFHYRGNVIEDAGNGVLYVGARKAGIRISAMAPNSPLMTSPCAGLVGSA